MKNNKKQDVLTVRLDTDSEKTKNALRKKAKKMGLKKLDGTGNINALMCYTINQLIN